MKKLFLLFLASGMFICSCSNKGKVENVLEGWWTMDTIYYKNYNIRTCLRSNSLEFKFGDNSEFPTAEDRCVPVIKNSYNQDADIEVVYSEVHNDTIPMRLKITTKNEVFAGTYKMVFYKDERNQLLKMEIYSDSLYIVCRKGLFNFDRNIGLIDELEEMTWSTRPKALKSK